MERHHIREVVSVEEAQSITVTVCDSMGVAKAGAHDAAAIRREEV